MFTWKLLHNAIPVGENLKARRVRDDVKCPFCNNEETALHLFFHCNFAQDIWQRAPILYQFDPRSISTIQQGLDFSKSMICLPPTGIESGSIGHWIIWAIWLERNKKAFGENPLTAASTLSKALNLAREWSSAQQQKIRPSPIAPNLRPLALIEADFITCNTDAAWIASRKIVGSGWCYTDQSGNFMGQGSAINNHISSPLIAEAQALLNALEHAKSKGYQKLIFASDSLVLVKATQPGISPKEIHGILQDILQASSSFSSDFFKSIPRETNFRADHLAKQALYQL